MIKSRPTDPFCSRHVTVKYLFFIWPLQSSIEEDAHYVDDDETACGIHITVENVDKDEAENDNHGGVLFHAHRPSGTEAEDEFKDF